jgi:hypothetical protein
MTTFASRRSAVAGSTLALLLLAACGGSSTSPADNPTPGGSLSSGKAPPGTSGDSAGRPAQPASPAPPATSDTVRNTPPAPVSASVIELAVYVGVAQPGPDTLKSTPAANARVSILRRTYVSSTGPDTLTVKDVLVASGTTDALGNVSFSNLPGVSYRIEAVAVDHPAAPAALEIAPPYASKVAASLFIRPPR